MRFYWIAQVRWPSRVRGPAPAGWEIGWRAPSRNAFPFNTSRPCLVLLVLLTGRLHAGATGDQGVHGRGNRQGLLWGRRVDGRLSSVCVVTTNRAIHGV